MFISPSHGEQIKICFYSNQELSLESELVNACVDDAMDQSESREAREKTIGIRIGEYL